MILITFADFTITIHLGNMIKWLTAETLSNNNITWSIAEILVIAVLYPSVW